MSEPLAILASKFLPHRVDGVEHNERDLCGERKRSERNVDIVATIEVKKLLRLHATDSENENSDYRAAEDGQDNVDD